jgi:hypothetical protein
MLHKFSSWFLLWLGLWELFKPLVMLHGCQAVDLALLHGCQAVDLALFGLKA